MAAGWESRARAIIASTVGTSCPASCSSRTRAVPDARASRQPVRPQLQGTGSAPGTETQEAVDLLRAHTPALAGADSTLVFSVEDGKITDPEPRAAIEGALEQVKKLDGVAVVADPFAEGGAVAPNEQLAAVDVRYRTDPAEIARNAKAFAQVGVETLVISANTSDPGAAGAALEMVARSVLPAL